MTRHVASTAALVIALCGSTPLMAQSGTFLGYTTTVPHAWVLLAAVIEPPKGR